MNKLKNILEYLDEVIPNPVCALNYSKDYELLIAVMLSAQTTDKRVNKVTKVLFSKYPSLKALKEASLSDVKIIVRELGNYTKKAPAVIEIAKTIDDSYDGVVPRKRCYLESMPMVGRKTTSVFLSEYYGIPNIAVDTHVDRVSKRLNLAKQDDSVIDVERKLKRKFPKDMWCKLHLQLVLFGRTKCTAKNPLCEECKLKNMCNYEKNVRALKL